MHCRDLFPAGENKKGEEEYYDNRLQI